MGRCTSIKRELEVLRRRYNTRARAEDDPVRFVRRYGSPDDQEVAGLIAASLAYGRLAHILRSVERVLGALGPSPAEFLEGCDDARLREVCEGFVHRFTDGAKLARLLSGIRAVRMRHGSLRACFGAHDRADAATVLDGLSGLARELREAAGPLDHLIPDPARGSACKRLNLYLRWMARRDAVDPGAWTGVSPARLLVPLDTHMWRLWRALGLTERRTCAMKAVLEITERLRELAPADPVRYDFALMHASVAGDPALGRLGVRKPLAPGCEGRA